ncbi:hypothetical protein M413DRAFT_78132 [Hebeloma cylindrosporum]|uniref:GH3 auxin-responsive promoter n=1 Tax=Hebeloma cylindrosporum TaxID=76867 RepID=A0A0C3BYH2_HEBCY|nr:hypothetical protein M413DRAFT_78132 [Hebeloma cylindrosporum h7]
MLLPSYKANTFMTTLFALFDRSLSVFQSAYSTSIYDVVRTLEEHWDTMIDAIHIGSLPELYDLGKYRTHIEEHFKPYPDRAQELRMIEKGGEGWLKKVWPCLRVVNATFSGTYAALFPTLQRHFGPTVLLRSVGYGATECRVGFAYGGNDTNLYRLVPASYTEFLGVGKENVPENLVQPWQVEVGKKYEVIVTNNDGLWRYQLNDIIEVAGFTPEEGIPLIRYVERKGVGFRIRNEFISESFLRDIMGSLTENTIGRILEFTTVQDYRKPLRAYGFFVELEGEIGRNPTRAIAIVKDKLQTDKGYKFYSESDGIGDPTIRILKSGTFKEYRHWKAETSAINAGQIKVPTMVADPVTVEWLAERVVIEVQAP